MIQLSCFPAFTKPPLSESHPARWATRSLGLLALLGSLGVHGSERITLLAQTPSLAKFCAPWLMCLGVLASIAQAADYPVKPITIVVGFSAGGSSDVIARLVAEKLTTSLGQPVIVENRPGVGSIVGATYAAHAKPDGYTLLLGASGPMVFNHALYAKLPYTPQDFTPVSTLCTFPLLLLTAANSPWMTWSSSQKRTQNGSTTAPLRRHFNWPRSCSIKSWALNSCTFPTRAAMTP